MTKSIHGRKALWHATTLSGLWFCMTVCFSTSGQCLYARAGRGRAQADGRRGGLHEIILEPWLAICLERPWDLVSPILVGCLDCPCDSSDHWLSMIIMFFLHEDESERKVAYSARPNRLGGWMAWACVLDHVDYVDLQQPGFRNRSSMLCGFTVDIRCLYSTACTKSLLQAWKCMTLCLLRKLPRTSVEILGAGTRQCFSMLFSSYLFFEVSASSARLGWKSIINTVLNHM